jgi:hypothetical protein
VEGIVLVLEGSLDLAVDTILVEVHMAYLGNLVQVERQEDHSVGHKVDRNLLGTGAAGDSQVESGGPPEVVAEEVASEEDLVLVRVGTYSPEWQDHQAPDEVEVVCFPSFPQLH